MNKGFINSVHADIIFDYRNRQERSKAVINVSENVANHSFNPWDKAVNTEPLSSIFIKIWLGTCVCAAVL